MSMIRAIIDVLISPFMLVLFSLRHLFRGGRDD